MSQYAIDVLIGWNEPYKLKRNLFKHEIHLDDHPLFSLGLDGKLAEAFVRALNGAYNNGKGAMYIAACIDLGIENGKAKTKNKTQTQVGKSSTPDTSVQQQLAGQSLSLYQRRRPKVCRPVGRFDKFREEVQRHVAKIQKLFNLKEEK